jgi:hypothetical protein
MLIFMEGGKPENLEKNPQSKGENQQQTQFTCDTKSWNPTRVTVVRKAQRPSLAFYSVTRIILAGINT